MTIEHSVIQDPYIHEPKGASTALAGTVYVSNGAGSGSWTASRNTIFGELVQYGDGALHTLQSDGIYSKIPGWSNGLNNGTTPLSGSSEIQIDSSGIYQINFYTSFLTEAIADRANFNFKYAINDTPTTQKITVMKPTSQVDALSCFGTWIVSLTAGQKISAYIAGDTLSATSTIAITDAGLQVIMLKSA